ncbi:hypothetical protein OIU77_027884 [Salix suchowensis]|uniref:Nodulin-like domain-containing protein n=1 Tax=Salix suchowensis TaxID=1278906 RepID=A0ABQ9BR73_9ROSI|nr:hypothetical protein OIU77_027884 [Salix suchowensis]
MANIVVKGGSRPPWVGLAAALWVEIAAGNAYNFPLYSPALKSVMGFNQQQLTMLGVANDIGENVGLLPGIACNKFPPWAILSVGVLACFLGYGVLWLAVSQTVNNLPYWLLWLALLIATNSNAWFGTAVLVTNMRNFPLSRGTVSGILKRLCWDLSCTMMYFIRPCTPASGDDSSEHAHFLFTQAAVILLAIYLLVTAIIITVVSLSDAVSYILVAIMVIFLISPLAIPVKMSIFPSGHLVLGEGETTSTDPLLTPSSSAAYLETSYENGDASDVEILLAMGEGAVKKKRRPKRGEDFRMHEALIKADFWLLWVVYFLGIGSGVTVLNNLAQIGAAFGLEDTTILLALFSFCNFAGRIGSGAVSEHFVRSRAIPRTVLMTCAHIIMSVAFVLFAFAIDGILYTATALLGICYGILYAVMVPTASELFGLRHFGVIYNCLLLGNPVGALLFSGILAGYIYDAEAARQGSSTCVGPDCFKVTFLALAGCCGLGSIMSIILTVRIWPVYEMLYSGGSYNLPRNLGH